MSVEIRKVAEGDLDTIVEMIREFAAFENLAGYCEVTRERLAAAMFGERSVVEGLLAVEGERPAGYAFFFPNFASFRGQQGLYLEDIYIRDEYRGRGLGERMLRQIASLAAERGFERIDFLVLDWNAPALRFYEKLGAARDDDERHYKFTGDAFRRLAAAR